MHLTRSFCTHGFDISQGQCQRRGLSGDVMQRMAAMLPFLVPGMVDSKCTTWPRQPPERRRYIFKIQNLLHSNVSKYSLACLKLISYSLMQVDPDVQQTQTTVVAALSKGALSHGFNFLFLIYCASYNSK